MKGSVGLARRTALAIGLAAGGGRAYAAAEVTRPSGEQSFRIIQTVEPAFPRNVDTQALTVGEARIVFVIDHEGRLADLLVASYTHPAFAQEAERALRAWRYEPARQYGEPVGVRASMTFQFESKGQVISTLAIDSMTARFNALAGPTVVNRVARPNELDAPITATAAIRPRHPGRGRRNDLSAGRVVLDFYIDEQGRPRMPVVLSSDDSAFAEAAAEALTAWRFVPPTRRGEPVIVRVQQAFEFAPITARGA